MFSIADPLSDMEAPIEYQTDKQTMKKGTCFHAPFLAVNSDFFTSYTNMSG